MAVELLQGVPMPMLDMPNSRRAISPEHLDRLRGLRVGDSQLNLRSTGITQLNLEVRLLPLERLMGMVERDIMVG